MAQLTVPSEPKTYTTVYEQLFGVDFKRDITSVDNAHSPDMVNMISDFGGNPVKRDGYRRYGDNYAAILTANAKVFGIRRDFHDWLCIDRLDLSDVEMGVENIAVIQKDFGNINNAFNWQHRLFIVTDTACIKFDTETLEHEIAGTGEGMMSKYNVGSSAPANESVIPITTITLKPDGTGGTAYQDVNLFSIYHTVMYGGDGTSTDYVIPSYKYVGTWVKVEVLNLNTGEWEELGASDYSLSGLTTLTGKTLDGNGTDSYQVYEPKVKFKTAPATVEGMSYTDNVRITFAAFSNEEVSEGVYKGYYKERLVNLLASKISTYYDNRMFIADNTRTYYSDVNEPFKVSDLHWFEVDNTIMCYTRASSYLAIITKDDGKNTVFLASQTTVTTAADESSGNVSDYAYAVKASNAGVGAVSPKCLGVLNDEPVFLSSTGLYAILTNYQSEKYAVNRSGKINRQLCSEPNLETAVGIAWNAYYFIAINSKMYVLDSRNKETNSRGDKSYECYYFNGLPKITDMYVVNNVMLFSDGNNLYKWNNDLPETARYYDDAHQVDGEWTGEPVKARWSSPFDDDRKPEKLKTLLKKGCMVTLAPHFKTGCEVTLVKNGNVFEYLGKTAKNIFTFENVNFDSFSFESNEAASDVFLKKKIKKYKRLQIIVENNDAEPFGIICVVKSYTYGNYAKR